MAIATALFLLALVSAAQADPDRVYRQAQQHLREGNLTEAEKDFRSLVEARPHSGRGYYGLGLIAAVRRDAATAVVMYRKALSVEPDFAAATLALAQAILESGRADQAVTLLEPLAAKSPGPEVHFALARAWAGVDAARSLPLLEKVFESSPENRDAWQLWIDITLAAGGERQAVARLEKEAQQRPSAAALRLYLGQLYVNRGALAGAEKEFRFALEYSGADRDLSLRARYSLGFLSISLGRIAAGEQILEEVLADDPSHLPALTALADLYLNTGRLEHAECLVARIRGIDAENPESIVLDARCLLTRKQAERAVTVLTRLVEKDPEHLQAHFFLGRALKEAGREAEAKRRLELFRELKNKKRAEAGRHLGLPIERVP